MNKFGGFIIKEILQRIKQLTDSLKTIEGIGTVTGLTDVIDIKGSNWEAN